MTFPTDEDLRAKVFRDREHDGDWRVKLDNDGETIAVTGIFSGDGPHDRAAPMPNGGTTPLSQEPDLTLNHPFNLVYILSTLSASILPSSSVTISPALVNR